MAAVLAIRVCDDVNLVTSSQSNGNVLNLEPWENDLDDDLVRVILPDRQLDARGFWSRIEELDLLVGCDPVHLGSISIGRDGRRID